MHRSGTSALAGCLTLAGAAAPQTLLESHQSNAKGFFESPLICEINHHLFQSLHSDWSFAMPLDWELLTDDQAEELQHRVQNVLASEFADASLLILKDPRFCRLLPFWELVLSGLCGCILPVIIFRHPSEVVLSLQANYRLADWHCLLLWLRYVLEAEYITRGMRRVVIGYEELLADGIAVVEKIAASLELEWPLHVDGSAGCESDGASPTLAERLEAFLSPDLRHHVADDGSESPASPLLTLAREIFVIMTDLAHGQPSLRHCRRLDAVRAELDQASALFAPLIGMHQTWSDAPN